MISSPDVVLLEQVRLADGRLQTYFCPYLESGYNDMLTEELVEQVVREKNETSAGRLRW